MTTLFPVVIFSVILIAICIDCLAQPSKSKKALNDTRRHRLAALPFRLLPITLIFACAEILTGRYIYAAILTIVTVSLLVWGSNLKRALLGEPLLFSDAAVIKACFQHPRFYVNALALPARIAVLFGIFVVCFAIIGLLTFDLCHLNNVNRSAMLERGLGAVLASTSWYLMMFVARTGLPACLMPRPDCDEAIPEFGLLATTTLCWLRWREDRQRPLPAHYPLHSGGACEMASAKAPIVIVIQCESFADPIELRQGNDWNCSLPALSKARLEARQYGQLHVSGFGAYTMRTEYGVLFGHDEEALGFRRFDPYLSAHKQCQDALPARLSQRYEHRLFIHPHDLEFYGRRRLMPVSGFNEMQGDEKFTIAQKNGPHLSDAALGERIITVINEAANNNKSTFVFAVTIENHGPWPEGLTGYLRHLRHGDALLGQVSRCLEQTGHPAVLAFYGDHRPSIPNMVLPGGAMHTPYLIQEFGMDSPSCGLEKDLTPAMLHHEIYKMALKVSYANI